MRALWAGFVALFMLLVVSAAPAAAAPAAVAEDLPTAIVSMGDSYISGEAGRWSGNWSSSSGDRGGTDRAAYFSGLWQYDASRIYGSTAGGCHRSDVAPILNNSIPVDTKINLACSGAVTGNIIRAENGGTNRNGEQPQADQLAAVAATHDVEMIVLSIGGNDLEFSGIVIDCVLRYNTSSTWWKNTCNGPQQQVVDRAMDSAMDGVAASIDEIRAVMTEAGQAPGSYRLVLQSYPSPIPAGSDFRYSESGWSRTFEGGCPLWNVDASWVRNSLVPQIADNLASVADAKGTEFLDLRDAFDGREVCADTTSQGNGADAEWGRFLVTGVSQGLAQESVHPNALGQQANGTCMGLLYAAAPGSYRCTNVVGSGPSVMNLD